MKLWPSDRLEIDTALPSDAIAEVLRSEVEPRKRFRLSRDHKTFEGTVGSSDFKIMRIIHYRNSFLPVIIGRINQDSASNRISIDMRLHSGVSGFLLIWFGGVVVGNIAALASLIHGQSNGSAFIVVPLGMLLVGWAVVVGAFWFEVNKAKPLLVAMFQGTVRERTMPSTVTSTRGTPAAGAPGAPGFRSGHG